MTRGFSEGAKVKRWRQHLDNPQRALKQIGTLAVAESRMAFRTQEFDGEPWPARAPVNVYGILADFAAGKPRPPARRFQRRPALRDTGALLRSIAFRVVSNNVVEWGSSLPYAATMNFGGPIESVEITFELLDALFDWLADEGEQYHKLFAHLFAPDMLGHKMEGEVEPRPFVGLTADLRADVAEILHVEVWEGKK